MNTIQEKRLELVADYVREEVFEVIPDQQTCDKFSSFLTVHNFKLETFVFNFVDKSLDVNILDELTSKHYNMVLNMQKVSLDDVINIAT